MSNFFQYIGIVIIICIITFSGILNIISIVFYKNYDGNERHNLVFGTDNNDVINAMGGNDIIKSGNGYDILICGSGYDIILDFDSTKDLILECEMIL